MPEPEPGMTIAISLPPTEAAGDRIGHYKLLQQIGEGGCGVVYMAEQQEPVKRRVALKVIKLGMDTKEVVARFEAERQALALMDHPNIAKVLDAGATETGRPFFVMDLVKGIPITRYCDENQLDTRQRLDLFIQVCQAIQHAHQKGIIHRDIKPSNILVADHDGVPVPKVIDFGIAKATAGQTLTDKTVFTAFEQFIGTPAYMSPEQAKLSGLDIDTRSDIYSLGVLLYELLTSKTPFDAKRLVEAGFDEIRRIIREEEPPRPSTKLSTLEAAEQTAVASRRHSEPPKLLGIIRGDLDWIVLKTLAKDRNRRYETANGLALDIERFLNNQPVVARPPSSLYQLQKLVRRNKLVFAAAALVVLSLVIGLGLATWMFLRENAARRHADMQAKRSDEVSKFLKEMLAGVGPSKAQGRDTTMLQEILGRIAERVGKDLKNQPEVEAELRDTIGNVYYDIGELAKAEDILRRAVQLEEHLKPRRKLALATSMNHLAMTFWRQYKYDEAEKLLREALALHRELLPSDQFRYVTTLNNLASVLNSRMQFSAAEILLREAVEIQRKLPPNENEHPALSYYNLAAVLEHTRKYEEAEMLAREALALQEKLYGSESFPTAATLNCLARVLQTRGKFDEAEAHFRKALEIRRKILSNNHPDFLQSVNNLGEYFLIRKNYAQALAIFREGAEHGDENCQANLAYMYQTGRGVTRDAALAAQWFQKAADQGHSKSQNNLGWCYEHGVGVPQDYLEAVKWYRASAEAGNPFGLRNLGWVYEVGRGVQKDEAQAMHYYLKSAEKGTIAEAHQSIAQMIARLGNQSTNKWLHALVATESAKIFNSVAWRLATSGAPTARNGPAAVILAEKAVAKEPTNGQYLDTLAAAYAETGQFDKAVEVEKKAIIRLSNKDAAESRLRLYESKNPYRQSPTGPESAEASRKRHREQLEQYRKAAEGGQPPALNELAWFLATCSEAELRDGLTAVSLAEKAVQATERKDAMILDTLSAAYAETGQFPKAISTQKEAIVLLEDELQKGDFASRLRLYESGFPYRQPD